MVCFADYRTSLPLCGATRAEGATAQPWINRLLPIVEAATACHPERTGFTRFIPPQWPAGRPGVCVLASHELVFVLRLMRPIKSVVSNASTAWRAQPAIS
jgi:hypothetical protein